MKKSTISIIMLLLSVWAYNASAQLADGFYHIKNAATGRSQILAITRCRREMSIWVASEPISAMTP